MSGDVSGYLFKLKENGRDWKKLYVVLRGTTINYYESPADEKTGNLMKDGVKQVLSACIAQAPPKSAGAPVATPAYMEIETNHARKVYLTQIP